IPKAVADRSQLTGTPYLQLEANRSLHHVNANGHSYLEVLAGYPSETFEKRFSRTAIGLGLGKLMNAHDLHRLYEAAFMSGLCHSAFKGLGGCHHAVRSDRERNRIALEREFMAARDILSACESWKNLNPILRELIKKIFLTVAVAEQNLVTEF